MYVCMYVRVAECIFIECGCLEFYEIRREGVEYYIGPSPTLANQSHRLKQHIKR